MYRFVILSICPYSADAFLEWLSPSNQSISMSNKNSLASLLSVLCHGLCQLRSLLVMPFQEKLYQCKMEENLVHVISY